MFKCGSSIFRYHHLICENGFFFYVQEGEDKSYVAYLNAPTRENKALEVQNHFQVSASSFFLSDMFMSSVTLDHFNYIHCAYLVTYAWPCSPPLPSTL